MTDVPIKWQLLQDAELLLHKIKKKKKMTDKHRLIFRKIHPTKQFHFNNLENFRNTKMPKTFLVTPCSEESTPANEGNCEALRLNSLGNNGRVNVRFLAITFRTTTVSISSRPHLPKVVGRQIHGSGRYSTCSRQIRSGILHLDTANSIPEPVGLRRELPIPCGSAYINRWPSELVPRRFELRRIN